MKNIFFQIIFLILNFTLDSLGKDILISSEKPKNQEKKRNNIRQPTRTNKPRERQETQKDDEEKTESESSSESESSRKSYSLNITFSSDKEESDLEGKKKLKPPQTKPLADKPSPNNMSSNINSSINPLKTIAKAVEKVLF